jgi:GntR family transcriptional regulator/MocR family aminotransferase
MAKTAWQTDLPLSIDRAADKGLSRQIYTEIARAILDSRLLPGARLPSARGLGKELNVARNTVNSAYDQLAAEGYIERVVGSGSKVSASVRVQPFLGAQKLSAKQRRPRLSRRGTELTNGTLAVLKDEFGAKYIGDPALDAFPIKLWKRLVARQLERLSPDELGYGVPGGYKPLRDVIAEYLARTRRMTVSPEQVIVVAGAQHALDLTARLLLDAGDGVLFEEPGYPGARAAFVAAGATLCPVRIDDEGMDLESLPSRKRGARLAYTTPAHQFPLGPTLSLRRRLALLEWAQDVNAWIIEDDYDGEFRFAGNPLSALASLDRSGRVIYIGTFSKVVLPALRLGFMVVPESLAERTLAARKYTDRHSPLLEQAALAAFMEEGHFARHIVRMRAIYAERRSALMNAFRKHAQDLFDVIAPETGVHVIARLRTRMDDKMAADVVRTCGLAAMPLSSYYVGMPKSRGFLVSFANIRDADSIVRDAVKALRAKMTPAPANGSSAA